MNQLPHHLRVEAVVKKGKKTLSDRPLNFTSRYHQVLWLYRA